ncbi:hypothetical protein SBC2_28330 [Caballeronia sp. SBC2]|nr:hypothetical protein SBC2_28330 [Caballeronia sp. SBC2]
MPVKLLRITLSSTNTTAQIRQPTYKKLQP